MRINKFLARATGLSRRAADEAVESGRVKVNRQTASIGTEVTENDEVMLDDQIVMDGGERTLLVLNKPTGYVVSRNGQGSRTVYDLLPAKYHKLKPVGRLDKDSAGLLILTNDGELHQQLTHPSYKKEKVYEIALDKQLTHKDLAAINKGVRLPDGISHMSVSEAGGTSYQVKMSEGRNRQIRRTFAALGYEVIWLNRIIFGSFHLGQLERGKYEIHLAPLLK